MVLDFFTRDRCFVIAEAGTCHAAPEPDERIDLAKSYVLAARDAGADAIKFQMFDDSDLFCPYQGDQQRKPRWKDSWLYLDDWRQIKEFAEACGMVFLASTFQETTVKWLSELGVQATKVASRAAETFPYDKASSPFLISMGMTTNMSLAGAVYLECEAVYPSTARWLGPDTGFSDHSGAPWRAIDAISRGCKLIEVHFYIDPLNAGPDLPASLDLDQLKLVCEARDAFADLRRK